MIPKKIAIKMKKKNRKNYPVPRKENDFVLQKAKV